VDCSAVATVPAVQGLADSGDKVRRWGRRGLKLLSALVLLRNQDVGLLLPLGRVVFFASKLLHRVYLVEP